AIHVKSESLAVWSSTLRQTLAGAFVHPIPPLLQNGSSDQTLDRLSGQWANAATSWKLKM
ncbi:hypothetical protein NPIL_4891, partial [Nephila pilipes]